MPRLVKKVTEIYEVGEDEDIDLSAVAENADDEEETEEEDHF